MRIKEIVVVAMLAGCVGCSSGTDTKAKDESDIRALEARFLAAFKAKDVNAIMSCYVPDQSLIVFDVAPPRQYNGAQGYRVDWEGYLTAFPGPWDGSMSDLDVTAGGDVGFGHSIQHASFTDKDGMKSEITQRVTDGYKKINGHWLIAHEHVSVPVDLTSLKPDLDSK